MFTGQEYHSVDSNSNKQKDNNKRGIDDTSKILNNKIPHSVSDTSAAATTTSTMNNSALSRSLDPTDINYSTNMAGVVDQIHDYTTSNRNSLTPQYSIAAGNVNSHSPRIF